MVKACCCCCCSCCCCCCCSSGAKHLSENHKGPQPLFLWNKFSPSMVPNAKEDLGRDVDTLLVTRPYYMFFATWSLLHIPLLLAWAQTNSERDLFASSRCQMSKSKPQSKSMQYYKWLWIELPTILAASMCLRGAQMERKRCSGVRGNAGNTERAGCHAEGVCGIHPKLNM